MAMSEARTIAPRGRQHDAAGAREAILNAAEEAFAEHGFHGARIDAIAEASGYNKSLIFAYFGDKLGLYAAVIRLADENTRGVQAQAVAALMDDVVVSDRDKFITFIKAALNAYLVYLVEHPRELRIQLWEMAEGWQTYAKIIAQTDIEDITQYRSFLEKAQKAGLLRSGLDPVVQVTLAVLTCYSYLGTLPLVQIMQPDGFPDAGARTREFMVDFIVRGLVAEPSPNRD